MTREQLRAFRWQRLDGSTCPLSDLHEGAVLFSLVHVFNHCAPPAYRLQQPRGTLAAWLSADPVLAVFAFAYHLSADRWFDELTEAQRDTLNNILRGCRDAWPQHFSLL